MTPVGAALIIGFIIILIVCIIIDKKGNEKFVKEMNEKYPVKEMMGIAYVTEKGEFLFALPSGTLSGFKKWDLKDVGYVSTCRGSFSILDRNKKTMRGEYLTPSKKIFLKEKAYATFDVGIDTVNEYVAFIQKHASHVQHISKGQIKK